MTIPINYSAVIYVGPVASTYNYTFTAGSDVRYLALSTIEGSTQFTNYASIFSQYKVVSVKVILSPLKIVTETTALFQSCGSLFCSVDPNETSVVNPTNSVLTTSNDAHMFSPNALEPRSCVFNFPGVGTNSNVYTNTDLLTGGGIYIGAITSATSTLAGTAIFDALFEVVVTFREIKIR
jgi:hypothetical protein